MSKYLVTGGAGFIGSHLVDRLIGNGHRVTVLDTLTSGFKQHLPRRTQLLTCDVSEFAHLSYLPQHDGIFHLAAIARTPWCSDEPFRAAQVNTLGTAAVLELARWWKRCRVIHASSNIVLAAHNPYWATKLAAEDLVEAYAKTYGLPALALRFSNVYGPRQSEKGPSPNVFAAFRKSLRETGKIRVTGDGTQTRDFTHVSDILDGLIRAMQSDYVGEPIDLCTGRQVSMNYVCQLWPAPIEYIPERHMDCHEIVQSPVRAKEILGWEAKVKLEDGLKDVLDCPVYLRE